MSAVESLARLWPADVAASEELRRSVAFLGWSVPAEDVVRAGYGIGILAGVGCIAVLLVTPLPAGPMGWLVTLAVALGAVHVGHAGPKLLATARRTAALGVAPELVVLAVLRMRLAPAPERAATFAAETGGGRLAESLAAHVGAARATGRTGFEGFADEWSPWFPPLGRSLGLVAAAGRVPPEDRDGTLDRALSVVLDGTEELMRDFAGSIHGPATALYAFGVLLPTALVSLLPAARAAGLAVTLPVVVAVYDVVLPLGLLAASAWLLSRRPVAFPPPVLGPDHPSIPDRRWTAAAAGLAAGAVAVLAVAPFFPSWAPLVAGPGVGAGVALLVRYRPYGRVRRRIRAIEGGLTDALSLVGRRVSHGASVERAIGEAAADLDGEMGGILADADSRLAAREVGIERAFLGDQGAVADVPSPRVRGSMALLAIAAREGRPAGRAILSVADHVGDLQRVEREARADLRTVVETLRSTGALFGPLVGGATVALAGHMDAGGLAGSGAPGIPWLGLAVGGYVLALSAILTTLSIGLDRGLDRSLIASRVGTGLLAATAAYLGGYVLAAALA